MITNINFKITFILIFFAIIVNTFSVTLRVPLTLISSLLLLMHYLYQGSYKNEVLVAFFIFIPSVIVNTINQNNMTIGAFITQTVTFFSFFLYSCYLIRKKKDAYKLSRILLVGYIAFLIVVLCVCILKGYYFSLYINDIFYNSSRNVVMQYLLFFTGFYICLSELNNKKINFLIITLSVFFSLLSGSRTALILTLAMFLIFLFRNHKIKLLLFFVVFSILFFIGNQNILDFIMIKGGNFSEGLNTPRTIMIHEFLSTASFHDYIFGTTKDKFPTIYAFNNPHNSIINSILTYGFGGIIFYITIIISNIYNLKYNFIFFMVGVVFLVRSSVDTILFNNYPSDIFIYYICFYFLINKLNIASNIR